MGGMIADLIAHIAQLTRDLAAERRMRRLEAEALKRAQVELDAMRSFGAMQPFNGVLGGEVKPRENQTMFDAIVERQKRNRGVVTPRWAEEANFYERNGAKMIEDGE